ncbi:hypothetical protein vB_Efae230P-4.22 [Enterococcus phage vB_Efae230P-4]|uniref:Uncharacterized protein n=1 Tax=Enterococcus phage vB_Efae230P-4 TaxID=1161939 RepID=A0A067XGT7_9CAUD|nr:hypothetical protein vB_Efae230P-4.22 [Enterococcus phage vB_Efae230P-4]AFF27954.1 hypothetical protein vB_Efae230P-4.22 [Enterococcus phage vB_Efae230P-4]
MTILEKITMLTIYSAYSILTITIFTILYNNTPKWVSLPITFLTLILFMINSDKEETK